MTLTDALDPFPLYRPAEVAALLGSHVAVSWIKARAREDATLVTRHTGRQTMLFTAEQVLRLRNLITPTTTVPATEQVTPDPPTTRQAAEDARPEPGPEGAIADVQAATSTSRPVMPSLNARH